jgi:dipeptidyl aminopeptidase/acylaminoacyl peptidase
MGMRRSPRPATNPHFESLQFLTSAGAWDSESKRFAFPGISAGSPVLEIVEADSGKKVDEITLKELDEVLNPAWSPDGNQIAFSGLVGGYNDLFVYNLSTRALRRLTSDAYAELDPAWSPDGRQLAFSTDRFSTKLPQLAAGHLTLAIMDVASGQVREAGGFDGAKNIDPRVKSIIVFLSDRQDHQHLPDSRRWRQPMQLTNILTGVSGIITSVRRYRPETAASCSAHMKMTGTTSCARRRQGDGRNAADPVADRRGRSAARRTGEGPVFAAIKTRRRA